MNKKIKTLTQAFTVKDSENLKGGKQRAVKA